MGMLHQSAGDPDRAEGCFHKTLYLDADHEEAHLRPGAGRPAAG